MGEPDDAQLRELLNVLSHDVRNPLAAIVTNLEFARRICERGNTDKDLVEAVLDSAIASDLLRRIIGNLDILVKGEQLAASLHDVELAMIVEEAARRCRSRAEQEGISIVTSLPATRRRAMLDRALFTLALENLIDDSLQHAPRDSTVRLELEIDEAEARVLVRDQAGAIPPELHELAVSAEGNCPRGRVPETRYGRGLALLSARLAARATGARLSFGGEGAESVMTITIPLVVTAE